jgi:hypothetical protein
MSFEYVKFSNIDELVFQYNQELKKEYLRQKPLETARSDYKTMVSVDEYETLLKKPVYDFSLVERNELMMMKFRNTTVHAVLSTASKIKGYIDYCVRAGEVPHNQNIFDTFIKSEAMKFVSKHATEFRYITPERLNEYIHILKNWQDKCLIRLINEGVRGRTVKGGTLEEIINLQIKPNSEDTKNCILRLVGNDGSFRELQVTREVMDLVLMTYQSEEYLPNNGIDDKSVEKKKGAKKYTINRYKNYVFCALGNSKFGTLNPITINARLQKIQEYCDNQFITVYNLYMSGMITKAIEIYKEKGELTSQDYINICFKYKYGGDTPEKYMSKLKYEVETYLKGGIQDA